MTDKLHFDDLTKIICPPGMLDEDTYQRLRNWNHGWERWSASSLAWREAMGIPDLHSSAIYRAKHAPMRKMSPPWDVIDARFNWAAMDSYGEVFFYTRKPHFSWGSGWRAKIVSVVDVISAGVLTFDRGTAPWDQSLVCRPGYEGDDA